MSDLNAAFEDLVTKTIAKHYVQAEAKKKEFRNILKELMDVVNRLFKLNLPEPQLSPYSLLGFRLQGTGNSYSGQSASKAFDAALAAYIKLLWEDTYIADAFRVCSSQLITG